MKDRSPQEFIDDLTYGMEQTFSFRGRTYFVQGATEPDGTWYAHMDRWEPEAEDFVWEHRAPTMAECVDAFVKAPLFDGLTFWQAEGEMTSLYA